MQKKNLIIIAIIVIVLAICGIYFLTQTGSMTKSSYVLSDSDVKALSFDMGKWNYDEENDIYYQLGVGYCSKPETTEYETLGIYVPGKYFDAAKNGDGTYNCTLNNENSVGNYTAANAPIVIPVNTPGYSAQSAPTSYSSQEVKDYTDNGMIYVYPGCRGRDNGDNFTGGAPWGVVDLKASVMFLKFNKDVLPGDSEKIISFGHSGGGAQSAILGASGDDVQYNPYLESIGAAMSDKDGNSISNSIYGAMCWCPITNLDTADEGYEWYMGQYSRSNDTWTYELSNDLAKSYAEYINNLNLKDSSGNTLKLEKSDNGIYTAGSYYDYQISVIEESLNNFLNDTTFPYSGGSSSQMGGQMPTGQMPAGDTPNTSNNNQAQPNTGSDNESSSGTYQTAKDYIDSLNGNETWIEYNESSNTVKVKSIEAFVKHSKQASKDVGAFDDLKRGQAENTLFGNSENDSLHFDRTMSELLNNNSDKYSSYNDYDSSYAGEYSADLTKVDKLNSTQETRVNMYNPLYYLCDYYNGSGTSTPAKIWRINTGIEQGDTATTVETNLALALNQTGNVEDVELNIVWNQGHTQAERTGDSTSNFIKWINEHSK